MLFNEAVVTYLGKYTSYLPYMLLSIYGNASSKIYITSFEEFNISLINCLFI